MQNDYFPKHIAIDCLKTIQNNIKNLLRNLNKTLKPECIILYGSFARGDCNERSDIDIIVISSQLHKNFYNRMQFLYDLIESYEAIDILGYTPNEFKYMLEKRHCTSLFAMEEGIPLYAKKLFKELKEVFDNSIEKYQLTKTSLAWVHLFLD